jgi:4-hydroxybenzoate polyprenyltransferase
MKPRFKKRPMASKMDKPKLSRRLRAERAGPSPWRRFLDKLPKIEQGPPDYAARFRRARRSAFATRTLPAAGNRLDVWLRLTRLNRPIGAFLLLWPTLWAVWIAGGGHPDPLVFVVFVAGVFVMRSAGCVMNDFADRRFDPFVRRTRDRPLATGEIGVAEAMAVFVVLVLVAVGLVLTMNRFTQYLAIAGLALAITYPFMKRFTWLPQPYLGMAFGWAIPMAFAAQAGALPTVTWLLFIANIFWATAYDTAYAMADREDDLKIGVKSSAILFGDNDRFMIALLQAAVLATLFLIGRKLELHPAFFWGLAVAAVFAVYEQWLIRKRKPAGCFKAFMNNNWFGAVIFAGLALSYIFRG